MANRARTVADVVAAEAGRGTLQQRFNDMVHIASVIANRARLGRVTPQQVVSVQREFNAYNKAMPPGTKALRGLAQKAIALVEQNGPITPATYYATPNARNSLPKGLKNVAQTKGHIYAVDPKNRSFKTAVGYVSPVDGIKRPSVDVAPNPNSYTVAHSRQFLPPDRPMPMDPPKIARQPGPGLAALAPKGLIGDKYNAVGSYDRSQLDSRLSGALNAIGSDPRFNSLGVKSGYRTPAQNRAVGGAKGSQHLSGKAVDISGFRNLSKDDQKALVDKAMTQGVRGLGLYSSGALHLDVRNSPAAWGVGGSYNSSPVSSFPAHLQQNVRDLVGLAPGQPYTPSHPSNIPTPTAKPATPAYEASQRRALAESMAKAGIGGLGATSQVAAPVGQVTRQSLPPDRAMPIGRTLAPDRTMPMGDMSKPNLAAALAKSGIPAPSAERTRPMPMGEMSKPNLAAALEKAKITTVKDSPPAQIDVSKTRVNPVTGDVQPGLVDMPDMPGSIRTFPSVSTATSTPVAPVASTPVSPVRQLMPTGTIATRPKVVAPVPSTVVAPVRTQPRVQRQIQPQVVSPVPATVVPPVQEPSVNVPEVPTALSQQDFNARYSAVTPGLKPGDVYAGAIGSAISTGGNIVSRANSYGPTTVTNKYGVTTATMPDGKQAAYSPSFGPDLSNVSGVARPAIGSLAGGALGSLVGGPIGGLIGGILGRQVATQGVSAFGGGGMRSQPGSGGGQTSGGLGGLLGGIFGGGSVKGNQRGGGEAGGGGAPGSKPSPMGGGGGKGNKRK